MTNCQQFYKHLRNLSPSIDNSAMLFFFFYQRCCCSHTNIGGVMEHWSNLSNLPVGQDFPSKSRWRSGERGRKSEESPLVTTLLLPHWGLPHYLQCFSSLGWLCLFATCRSSCVSLHHLRRLILPRSHSVVLKPFMSLPAHFDRLVNSAACKQRAPFQCVRCRWRHTTQTGSRKTEVKPGRGRRWLYCHCACLTDWSCLTVCWRAAQ